METAVRAEMLETEARACCRLGGFRSSVRV